MSRALVAKDNLKACPKGIFTDARLVNHFKTNVDDGLPQGHPPGSEVSVHVVPSVVRDIGLSPS